MQTNISTCTVYIGEFRNSFSCFHTSYILTLAKVALNNIYVCHIIILYQFTEVIHNRSSVEGCKLDRLLHNHVKAGIGIHSFIHSFIFSNFIRVAQSFNTTHFHTNTHWFVYQCIFSVCVSADLNT